MAHLAHVTQPVHPHVHKVWLLPDSPLGRWTASLTTGGVLLLVLAGGLASVATDGPWVFLLLGITVWSVVVAATAGLVAAVALLRDHALALGFVVLLGVAATATLALELSR